MGNFVTQNLPLKRTNKRLVLLTQISIIKLAGYSLLFYLLLVLFFSIIYAIAASINVFWLYYNTNIPVITFSDIVYFNFATILTVGYGDIIPVGIGRIVAVFEAITGVAILTTLIALITTKMLLPAKNTIVFSEYAYYCTDNQRFLIIYLNTSNSNMINVETSSYFKLGGDWRVISSVTSPFITQAVQTFFVNQCDVNDLIKQLRERDCLRVGIAGDIGFTQFSTSIEYPSEKILVIPNRDVLIKYEGFHKPDLKSKKFTDMFHYKPDGAPTLEEYIRYIRSKKQN